MSCRIRKYAMTLVVALMGSMAFADAEPTQTQTQAAATEQKPAPPKLVCKREAVLGSNIKTRTCRSQAQIDAQREELKQNMDRMNDGKRATSNGG